MDGGASWLKDDQQLLELKRTKLALLEREADERKHLPHLHGYPRYKWQKEFIDSRNKLLFLTAANQIGKSSVQIMKSIHWATSPDLWPELFHNTPLVFWYLYPSLKVWDLEVKKKWIPEFLPRGPYKDHPVYGWRTEKASNGLIQSINFNSGVSIIGKSYLSEAELLQTGTVWYLAFDEEMPIQLWPELQARVRATRGYISGVFTPTLSQQFWFDVMEERGKKEKLKDAHKIQASLFDCLTYHDGRPSFWTIEDINKAINESPNEDEVQRRIYGRFIMNKEVLKYPSFSEDRNVMRPESIPPSWIYYAGIDSGSGGTGRRHPAAISIVAVSPDYKKGRVVTVWRGTPDQVEGDQKDTTAADVLRHYVKLTEGKQIVAGYYDYADADMGIIAQREGIPLIRAEKRHDRGEPLLNTLFKNQILWIDDSPQAQVLIAELSTLRNDTFKQAAKDDCIDSARYAVTLIPWDLSSITGTEPITVEKKYVSYHDMLRDRRLAMDSEDDLNTFEKECEELNDLYEA